MITGFLKDNCMKLTTGSGDNVGRISARRAWIPLKKGKAELMVHEIAVNCGNGAKSVGLGLPKTDHREESLPLVGEGRPAYQYEGSEPTGLWVPARAVLALLLALSNCVNRVCSHMSGTDRRLLGMARRAANVGEQVRISSKLRRRDWLFESRRWLR